MDSQFWIKAWMEGRTGFHQKNYNQELVKYFPELKFQQHDKVLVPLCGKTKDMLWLRDQGLSVVGIELYQEAVKEFFTQNNLTLPESRIEGEFISYTLGPITIKCGNFFKIDTSQKYDFIFDRAALVALPREMRKEYAEVLKRCLRPQGKYLLITYEYNQSLMDGPPFSVSTQEVHELFGDKFSIKLMEESSLAKDSSRLATIEALLQKVYVLESKI